MRIELGKSYRTRDGRKVIITDYVRCNRYPWEGRIDSSGDYKFSWMDNGHSTIFQEPHDLDLIAPWEESPKPEVWYVIGPIRTEKFDSLELAKKYASDVAKLNLGESCYVCRAVTKITATTRIQETEL